MPTSARQNAPFLRKFSANSQLPSGPKRASAPTKLYTNGIEKFELLQASRERSKKTKGVFLGALKGAPGGNRNPPGLVFFLQLFLLEKQKKMLNRTRKFLKRVAVLTNVSSTTQKHCGFTEGFLLFAAARRDVSGTHASVLLSANRGLTRVGFYAMMRSVRGL